MRLNRLEFIAMNNPLRAWVQRHFEARRLLDMGGPVKDAAVLEVGCGRGVGIEIILKCFRAAHVDAFDLDERMVQLARRRTARHGSRVTIWAGDACHIPRGNACYDAVFDFGIVHHVPDWRAALSEIHRVLKPDGRFYTEEVYRHYIDAFPWRHLFKHPLHDRFDADEYAQVLRDIGFTIISSRTLGRTFGWLVADKNAAPCTGRSLDKVSNLPR
jgi:ubiquinone/menaquinone biosynthesis C-methylase UbiE